MVIALVLVAAALGATWLAVSWGSKLDRVNPELTTDQFGLFFGVLRGSVVWPGSGTWIMAVTVGILVVPRYLGQRSAPQAALGRKRTRSLCSILALVERSRSEVR